MNDNQIILKDGMVIDGCSIAYESDLWIYCPLTMKDAAEIFLNEELTDEILFVLPDHIRVFEHFTEAMGLNVVPGGVRVMLTGEDKESHDIPRDEIGEEDNA